jgi:hypothetical protein
MLTDLAHQSSDLLLERGIGGVEALQALHGFLGLGMLALGTLRLLLADLFLDLRIDGYLLGYRVPDQLNGDLVDQVLAAVIVGAAPRLDQRLQLAEHGLHLTVVLGEDVDDVLLLVAHCDPLVAVGVGAASDSARHVVIETLFTVRW